MSYRYGGKMNPIKKKRIMKGIACSILALSVFSGMSSGFAWHFVPWIYHLPTSTSDSAQEKFNWNEVKDTVNNGLNNLEKEERKQYGSNYYVDKIYSSNGKNYTWESYQWDWSSEGGGKIIISHFDFDTVGGTIATWRKYGEGDWVKERPPGWPYGDDFAMYKRLFSSTIPIRDQADGSNVSLWHNLVNIRGDATNIISALKILTDTDIPESQKKGSPDRVKQKIKQGNLDKLLTYASILNGDFKGIINKIRDPNQIFNSVASYMLGSGSTIDNSELSFGFKNNGVRRKDEVKQMENYVKDVSKFLLNINTDITNVHVKNLEDSEKSMKDMQKLSNSTSYKGAILDIDNDFNSKETMKDKESVVDSKIREEQLHRLEFAMDLQQEKVDAMEQNHKEEFENLMINLDSSQNLVSRNMAHMPTPKEIDKDLKEKQEKYSVSRDLGWRKFGQNEKADFSKILSGVIEPDYDEMANEKEKMKNEGNNKGKNSG